eukprot:CAMPEP_0181169010 /NCGR_PEP_ID=MMETSP1096-20121128/585_1 /TAXON_ID=156174 ORGANISM="Chrysochromulina ericina, Strain CCMP281" /NCGR_SAMPLE_ID=MMETSP1096 /ASSEMBLY_ACC=CAM_ASM_000453 /LENGTH=144 /DNA_ID=CAMNT_0023256437 /DNA_START=211 /DNA_END=645 /DNA_ORIENTATION=-
MTHDAGSSAGCSPSRLQGHRLKISPRTHAARHPEMSLPISGHPPPHPMMTRRQELSTGTLQELSTSWGANLTCLPNPRLLHGSVFGMDPRPQDSQAHPEMQLVWCCGWTGARAHSVERSRWRVRGISPRGEIPVADAATEAVVA